METITMMDLRKSPGEYAHRAYKHGELLPCHLSGPSGFQDRACRRYDRHQSRWHVYRSKTPYIPRKSRRRVRLACRMSDKPKPPEALEKIARVVLAYRPKPSCTMIHRYPQLHPIAMLRLEVGITGCRPDAEHNRRHPSTPASGGRSCGPWRVGVATGLHLFVGEHLRSPV